MDVSYYRTIIQFLKFKTKRQNPALQNIYSRPQKQGRKVFGELVEYAKVWRLGANEATEIEFYKCKDRRKKSS